MFTRTLSRRTGTDMGESSGHPEWCARTHACGLGEHRAQPVTLSIPGRGAVVLTRVRSANGREHAEIRTTIELAPGEYGARAHLAHVLAELETHLRRAIRVPGRRHPGST